MKKIFKFLVQYYLKLLAKIALWRHKPLIVAISGTTNKTFIKELLLDEIGDDLEARGNPRSFNTEIGLPLAVLFLPSGYSSILKWLYVLFGGTLISLFGRDFPSVLVLEMGVDCKGDMNYLLSIVKPDMAIITNVDRSYPNNNTSVDDVVDEMKQLVKSIDEKGTIFLNGDDNRVGGLKSSAKANVVVWGNHSGCEVNISNIKKTDTGQSFNVKYDEKEELIEINKFGYHNVSAKTISIIVAKEILKQKQKSV